MVERDVLGHEAIGCRVVRLPIGDGLEIAASVYRPAGAVRALVWCVPGGAVDRRYWDVPVDGAADGDYSFPQRAAAAGYLVVTADHLGTGESSRPGEVDADRAADAMSTALAVARRDLELVGLPSVGMGHSMGSGLTLHQQDRHHDHAALVITGWSNIALTLPYEDGVFRPLGGPGRLDLRRHNHQPDVPDAVHAANRRIITELPHPALEWITAAGQLAGAAARVDVPVMVVQGIEDVSPDPAADAALYTSAPDVHSIVLAGSHHWHSGATDRHVLWDEIVEWLDRRFAARIVGNRIVIDRCDECGFDGRSLSRAGVVAALGRVPGTYAALIAGADRTTLAARPDPSAWSALEYLVHVRDLLAFHRWLIERALAEDLPPIPTVDPDKAVAGVDLGAVTVDELLAQISRRAERLADAVGALDDGAAARLLVIGSDPPIDVTLVTRSAVHEAHHHAGDVRRSVAAATAQGV